MVHILPATSFVIVPPTACRHVDVFFLADVEAALVMALPSYEFEVTIDHPQRQDDDFFVEPNGVVSDIATIEKLASALARFTDFGPSKMIH
ncbi:hypothetical protein [Mesorhizobium sp. M8A.F.Ca.ET.165.01.1.1]|uniref:hypothetical protein n=1 Tax=Mesorhizobium sp. M8A.F.Ca.ET.165.01.1.1 TaxID=2563960 RepID=UPI00109382AF|nr:hypothetical protein [Mesorhizobium sp. M8A.F.Ca.ET.165.01.1.1]TGT34957.1 hypothetical protein EN808_34965 [Mesorhizobium sp. M8A.F.Ca.ET.165.01.1.1]